MTDLDQLAQDAVDAAIAHNWPEAVRLNKEILAQDKHNFEAHLRLGFASLQVENIADARKFYQQALKIQPKNPVALENLERISILEETGGKNPIKIKATLDPNLFLETPGKTKSVTLVNLGQKNHIAELDMGEKVELKLKRRKIEVRTLDGSFIGYLPDDVSKRLIYFLENNSTYSANVKEANSTRVVIFVREEKKGAKVAHYSSFPSSNSITSLPKERDADDDEGEESDATPEDEWASFLNNAETEGEEEPKETDYPLPPESEDEVEE